MNNKTLWQKFYSALGFWSYYTYNNEWQKIRVFYWCCFPYGHFFRKFDLFSYKVKK